MPDISNAIIIITTGALAAGACALLGCFLVLRRMAMLGDAISHAILLGIVLAFLIVESMASLPMFLGAVFIGILTTFFVQSLSTGGVQEDAAIGVTFTALFALGVVGVSLYGRHVDLDLDCVLYGEIVYAPFYPLMWGDVSLGPASLWINGGLFVLNLLIVSLLYKGFKLCSFDPGMAAAVGIPVTFMHYLLMSMVAVTTVGTFQSVGAILVVAMLIAPAASAYLLTDRLSLMLVNAVIIGFLSSFLGYLIASWLDCSIAGAIGSVAGLLFILAFFLSPKHGLIIRWITQRQLRHRVAEEDVLLWAARRLELGKALAFTPSDVSETHQWLMPEAQASLKRLDKAGLLDRQTPEMYALSSQGLQQAKDLIRRHRLYETYLGDLGYASDHIHDPADRVEHHLSPLITERLDVETKKPDKDPHGKTIPR